MHKNIKQFFSYFVLGWVDQWKDGFLFEEISSHQRENIH